MKILLLIRNEYGIIKSIEFVKSTFLRKVYNNY